jgi:hypothetical protein
VIFSHKKIFCSNQHSRADAGATGFHKSFEMKVFSYVARMFDLLATIDALISQYTNMNVVKPMVAEFAFLSK